MVYLVRRGYEYLYPWVGNLKSLPNLNSLVKYVYYHFIQ